MTDTTRDLRRAAIEFARGIEPLLEAHLQDGHRIYIQPGGGYVSASRPRSQGVKLAENIEPQRWGNDDLVERAMRTLREGLAATALETTLARLGLDDPTPSMMRIPKLALELLGPEAAAAIATAMAGVRANEAWTRRRWRTSARAPRITRGISAAGTTVTAGVWAHGEYDPGTRMLKVDAVAPDEAIAVSVIRPDRIELRLRPVAMPDTVITTLPGRPLSALLSHPVLDGHPMRIEEIKVMAQSLRVSVAPEGGFIEIVALAPPDEASAALAAEMERAVALLAAAAPVAERAYGGRWDRGMRILTHEGLPHWDETAGPYTASERDTRLWAMRSEHPGFTPPPTPDTGIPMAEDRPTTSRIDSTLSSHDMSIRSSTLDAWTEARPDGHGARGGLSQERAGNPFALPQARCMLVVNALRGLDPEATAWSRRVLAQSNHGITDHELSIIRRAAGGVDAGVALAMVLTTRRHGDVEIKSPDEAEEVRSVTLSSHDNEGLYIAGEGADWEYSSGDPYVAVKENDLATLVGRNIHEVAGERLQQLPEHATITGYTVEDEDPEHGKFCYLHAEDARDGWARRLRDLAEDDLAPMLSQARKEALVRKGSRWTRDGRELVVERLVGLTLRGDSSRAVLLAPPRERWEEPELEVWGVDDLLEGFTPLD